MSALSTYLTDVYKRSSRCRNDRVINAICAVGGAKPSVATQVVGLAVYVGRNTARGKDRSPLAHGVVRGCCCVGIGGSGVRISCCSVGVCSGGVGIGCVGVVYACVVTLSVGII